MKEKLLAIYNTLGTLEMPPTPNNTKHLAGIYALIEKMFDEAAQAEHEQKQGCD